MDNWPGQGCESNLKSAVVVCFLSLGLLVNSYAQIIYAYLQGAGRADLTGKLHLIEVVPHLLILGIAISSFGIIGAAVVSSVGYICYMSFILLMHRKEYKSRFADFLLFRKKDGVLFYKLLMEKITSRKTDVV